MNVKFKMINFKRDLTRKGWIKELLLTFVATTISIVLTFGTAQYFEQKQKEADARLLAMMVIHDMDNTVDQLRRLVKEDADGEVEARYALDNYDKLDSLDYNLLAEVLRYILAEGSSQQQYPLDEASEKVFLSSQDSWKNIDNPAFIDAVQAFYIYRHQVFDILNTDWSFRKPISNDADYEATLKFGDSRPDFQDMIKEYLPRREVAVFINDVSIRQTSLNDWAETCERMSNACKFAMGITDKEMDEYVKTRQVKGQNVTEHELIGRWVIIDTPDRMECYDFMFDHTYLFECVDYVSQPYFTGVYIFTATVKGSWELRDDSLFMYLKDLKYESDASNITAKSGMEKQTNNFVEFYKAWAKDGEKHDRELQSFRYFTVSIDKSGTKIEMVPLTADNEAREDDRFYMTKEEK